MSHYLSSRRKNNPCLCLAWASQFQSGGNWSLGLPMAKLSIPWAWISLTTAREPTFFILTIHFQALCQLSKHLKEKVLNFSTFLTSRLRGGEGLEIAVWHKNSPWPSNSCDSTNYFIIFLPGMIYFTQQIASWYLFSRNLVSESYFFKSQTGIYGPGLQWISKRYETHFSTL